MKGNESFCTSYAKKYQMEIKVLVPLMLKLSNILLFKSTKTNILKWELKP